MQPDWKKIISLTNFIGLFALNLITCEFGYQVCHNLTKVISQFGFESQVDFTAKWIRILKYCTYCGIHDNSHFNLPIN